ncbi:hypothetical protein [Streptomyces durhamensis]|uniref:hypothetical protein n=1 Tax=Streptomyces durhamensis TaxID=68194 RepID=UPI0006892CE1|nr:hypothetical protein [Streptomyces durhamensis]
MSRALPKYDRRRVALIGGAAAVVLSGAVIAGSALAGTPAQSDGAARARTLASPGTITCPDVASELPAVPASARAEVDRNLALLQTQADKRLQTSAGQGGPHFVDNAILGPLKDKRASTIDRIALAIGRTTTKPTGLAPPILGPLKDKRASTIDRIALAIGRTTTKPTGLAPLAACALNATGGAAGKATGSAPSAAASRQAGTGATAGGNPGTGTITCPDVASELPAVPASARAEVDRNLALLQTPPWPPARSHGEAAARRGRPRPGGHGGPGRRPLPEFLRRVKELPR